MTLSPDLRHAITSHTANMNPMERRIRAQALIKRYGVAEQKDVDEVAMIAGVRPDVLQPASMQAKII